MVVAGGVACNQMLRDSLEQFTQEADWQLVCPKPSLCTDNGVMVAWAGVERSGIMLIPAVIFSGNSCFSCLA